MDEIHFFKNFVIYIRKHTMHWLRYYFLKEGLIHLWVYLDISQPAIGQFKTPVKYTKIDRFYLHHRVNNSLHR